MLYIYIIFELAFGTNNQIFNETVRRDIFYVVAAIERGGEGEQECRYACPERQEFNHDQSAKGKSATDRAAH